MVSSITHGKYVWFWWINETLSANLVHLRDHEIGRIIPSGEATVKIMMMDLEKKKEKNKKLKAKVKFDRSFLVWWSRHLVSVITFMIDSRTIKWGESRIKMRLSKYH